MANSPGVILMLDADTIRRTLDYPSAVDLMTGVFERVSRGLTISPERFPIRGRTTTLGVMSGYDGGVDAFTVKSVVLNSSAPVRSHAGVILLFDGASGACVAALDGAEITARRTAAASAAASRVLARPDSKVLAVLGAGEQARAHIGCFLEAFDLQEVRVWSRNGLSAAQLSEHVAEQYAASAVACDSVREATEVADIVCTCTSAVDPVLGLSDVGLGTHVCLVGSSFADRAEVEPALVAAGRYYVDRKSAALTQAGEFLRGLRENRYAENHIAGEIGQVLTGELAGRRSDDELTIFKSLGVPAQDVASAAFVYAKVTQHDQSCTAQ